MHIDSMDSMNRLMVFPLSSFAPPQARARGKNRPSWTKPTRLDDHVGVQIVVCCGSDQLFIVPQSRNIVPMRVQPSPCAITCPESRVCRLRRSVVQPAND